MNKVSYKEASELLGVKKNTLEHAVTRGVFTHLPLPGVTKFLPQAQVELFKGKRLSLNALSREDRKEWEEIDSEVSQFRTGTAFVQGMVDGLEGNTATPTSIRSTKEEAVKIGKAFSRGIVEGLIEETPSILKYALNPLVR